MSNLPRKFVHGSAVLTDPNPAWPADQVKKMYATAGYPDLANASVVGPEIKDGFQVYTFQREVGRKG